MFTNFRIVQDDRPFAGVLARDVVAVFSEGAWHDPHGGLFSEEEEACLFDVAFGKRQGVSFSGRGYVACRLVAEF